MRQLLLALCLLVSPLLAQHATGQTVQARSGIPTVTIGDGISSSGDLNTDGIAGGVADDRVFDRAIDSLPTGGGVIAVGAGTYYFDRWVTVRADNIRLTLARGAILIPRHTGSYGLFRVLSADGFVIDGGELLVDQPNGDQVGISVDDSDYCQILSFSATVSTSVMTSANPYTVIGVLNGSDRMRIDGVSIYPNAGVRALQLVDCVAPNIVDFYVGPTTGTTPRACWRVIDIDGGSDSLLQEARISYLGTTAAPLDSVLRYYDNNYAAGSQHGDLLTGVRIRDVACRTMFHSVGRKGWKVIDSQFSNANTSVLNTNNYTDRFDAAILVDNTEEAVSAEIDNQYSAHCMIANVEFDGASGLGASDIYIKSVAKMEVSNTRHVHFIGRFPITIDADHCIDISVKGSYFDGQYATKQTQYSPILVINRLAASGTEQAGTNQNGGTELWQEVENITISGCHAEGWLNTTPALSGGLGAFPPSRGVRGSYWPFGIDGFQSYIASTAIETTAGSTIAAAAATPAGGTAITTTTITRSGGSWITEGHRVGQSFSIDASENAGENDGTYVLTAVTPAVLTTTGLTANAADTTATFQPHLFESMLVGDWFMMMGHTDEENWGVRTVAANTGPSMTVSNPDWKTNCDPTFAGTALSAGSGFTTVAFGDGTGVITRTGGSDWTSVLKLGMSLTIASSDETGDASTGAGNDIATRAMITAVTSTTVTLQGITFTADASDANAVLTPYNGGWGLTTEAAGDSVEVFVFPRSVSEINFSRPLSTNIAGRRIR